MKSHKRGEIVTILAISALVVLGITTIASSFFVNKKQTSTNTRASENSSCKVDVTPCDIPSCNGSITLAPGVYGDPLKCIACAGGWCNGGVCGTCGTEQIPGNLPTSFIPPTSAPQQPITGNNNPQNSQAGSIDCYVPPESGAQPKCESFFIPEKNKYAYVLKSGNSLWQIANCKTPCKSASGEQWCYGFSDAPQGEGYLMNLVKDQQISNCVIRNIPGEQSSSAQPESPPSDQNNGGTNNNDPLEIITPTRVPNTTSAPQTSNPTQKTQPTQKPEEPKTLCRDNGGICTDQCTNGRVKTGTASYNDSCKNIQSSLFCCVEQKRTGEAVMNFSGNVTLTNPKSKNSCLRLLVKKPSTDWLRMDIDFNEKNEWQLQHIAEYGSKISFKAELYSCDTGKFIASSNFPTVAIDSSNTTYKGISMKIDAPNEFDAKVNIKVNDVSPLTYDTASYKTNCLYNTDLNTLTITGPNNFKAVKATVTQNEFKNILKGTTFNMNMSGKSKTNYTVTLNIIYCTDEKEKDENGKDTEVVKRGHRDISAESFEINPNDPNPLVVIEF